MAQREAASVCHRPARRIVICCDGTCKYCVRHHQAGQHKKTAGPGGARCWTMQACRSLSVCCTCDSAGNNFCHHINTAACLLARRVWPQHWHKDKHKDSCRQLCQRWTGGRCGGGSQCTAHRLMCPYSYHASAVITCWPALR